MACRSLVVDFNVWLTLQIGSVFCAKLFLFLLKREIEEVHVVVYRHRMKMIFHTNAANTALTALFL